MNNKGFSLVEVLVAILLMSITLGSLVFILGSAFDGVFTSSHKNKAIYNAQNSIEEKIAIGEQGEISNVDEIPGSIEIEFPELSNSSFYSTGNVVVGEGVEKGVISKVATFIPDDVESILRNDMGDE